MLHELFQEVINQLQMVTLTVPQKGQHINVGEDFSLRVSVTNVRPVASVCIPFSKVCIQVRLQNSTVARLKSGNPLFAQVEAPNQFLPFDPGVGTWTQDFVFIANQSIHLPIPLPMPFCTVNLYVTCSAVEIFSHPMPAIVQVFPSSMD